MFSKDDIIAYMSASNHEALVYTSLEALNLDEAREEAQRAPRAAKRKEKPLLGHLRGRLRRRDRWG